MLVVGVVSSKGLGDALQYSVASFLLSREMPNAEITLALPELSSAKFCIIDRVKVLPGLEDQSSILRFIRRNSASEEKLSVRGGFQRVSNIRHIVWERYSTSEIAVQYLRPWLCRLYNRGRYSGGAVGGHTIEHAAFISYLVNYNCARAVVDGPLVTFPISASWIGLERRRRWWKLLRKSLNKLDVIFVRGRFSREILSRFVEEGRLYTALDSGFGVRFLFNKPIGSVDKSKVIVGIVPRRDYFEFYGLHELYQEYLRVLKVVVEGLVERYGVEVVLIAHSVGSDELAIAGLLKMLSKRVRKAVRVATPRSVADSVHVISSCDFLITSRMHAGVIALAYGKPAVFFMPRGDVKVRDVLLHLGLEEELYLIDAFNPKEYGNLWPVVVRITETILQESRVISHAVNRRLEEVKLPVRVLRRLLEEEGLL